MVSIVGYEQPYLEGLRAVAEGRRERDHLLVLFLGRIAHSRCDRGVIEMGDVCPRNNTADDPVPAPFGDGATLRDTVARTPRC